MKTSLLIFSSVLIALQIQRAIAGSVWAVDVDPSKGYGERLGQAGMIGWTFLLTEPVTVTGLGWYDQNRDGLSEAHQLGVWQNYGTNAPLLFSLVIPAGTSATLNGSYREVDLASPTNLPIGSYVIAGSYDSANTDAVMYVDGFLAPDPRMLIGVPAYAGYLDNAPLFRIPNLFSVDPFGMGLELGPNLFVVPLPSLQATRSGNQLVISWPLWATNYVLETSSTLESGASWTTLTNATVVSDDSLIVTNSIGAAPAFYRLLAR